MKEDPGQDKYCCQAYEKPNVKTSTSYIHTKVFIPMYSKPNSDSSERKHAVHMSVIFQNLPQ